MKFQFLPALGIAATLLSLPNVSVAQVVPINFNWDWKLEILPTSGVPLPGDPIPLSLWGPTTINFGPPSPFFDLGTQENPLPPPAEFERFEIPTEIVSMNLVGTSPDLGNVVLRQSATQPSLGAIVDLRNEGGILTAVSFFDLNFELEFDNPSSPGQRMTLFSDGDLQTPGLQPIFTGMFFTPQDQIPELDTFWLPTWLWTEFPANSTALVDQFGVPWDTVIRIHAHQTTPEPTSILGFLALGTLGAASTLKRKLKPSQSTEKETTKVG